MKQKQALILIITIVALLTTALPAWAAGPVSVTLTADKNELTVGDPVKLTLARLVSGVASSWISS